MRGAGFTRLQHDAALQHATAGITIVTGPAMDLEVHLYALNLCDLVGALDRLLGICEAASIARSAPHNRFVRLAAVVDGDPLCGQHTRCVAGSLVKLER